MKRKWKFLLCFVLLLGMLPAAKWGTSTPLQVVTNVELICREDEETICRRYTKPHKVQQVLNYLRLQKDLGKAEIDPERVRGTALQIDVCLSDGTRQVYYQRAGQYLSRQYHTWQKIDPKRAEAFTQSVRVTPGDI